MSLKAVNLNLLPVLRELLRRRSISGAGRALGRSPPAISEGLAQLRQALGDPLLVRVAGRMELTRRAIDLIDPVEAICAQIEHLYEASAFDAASTDRLIVIAAHDFHVFAVGPDLVRNLHAQAPGSSLRFVDVGHDLAQGLASRDIDFALLPDFHLGDLAPARLLHETVMINGTVVLMREGHPLAAQTAIDPKALAQFEHIAFHPNWEPVDFRRSIGAIRRRLPVRARTAQITTLPFFLPGTDYVALVPGSLAERLGTGLGLVHRPMATDEPIVRSVVAWSPLQDADPAHRWFRSRLIEILRGLSETRLD